MFQVMDAVRYLHTNRIIHRDIKPQNIIITPDGRAVLVDFGIAKVMITGQMTVTAARGFGSPGYASPEHYTGGMDERSDVYALGATLYFALTANEPIPAPERAYGTHMEPISQRNQGVSAKTQGAVMKAMALAGMQRHLSVSDFEFALGFSSSHPHALSDRYKPFEIAKGRYKILQILTQDHFGIVCLCEDILFPGKRYVIKAMGLEHGRSVDSNRAYPACPTESSRSSKNVRFF